MANIQPSTITNPAGMLVGNLTTTIVDGHPLSGADNVPTPTQVNGVNIASILELQSTTGAFVLPRMTTAQRDALTPIVNGMQIYNISPGANAGINTVDGGVWSTGGGGDVDGPAASTNFGIAAYNGITGKSILNTLVQLNPVTSVISAIGGLISAAGTAAAPTMSFTGDTDTGIYQSGANAIGFATAGVKQFVVSGAATTVNNLNIAGSATTAAVTMTAEGTDAAIHISAVPKGVGAFLSNAGTGANPGYAFNGNAITRTSGFYLTQLGTAQTNYLGFSVNATSVALLSESGVLNIGGASIDTTMTNGISLVAGTAPTGQANTLNIFGATVAGNVGTLGLRIPAGSLTGSVDNAVTNKVQVTVNGTTYYLLATTSAA